MAETLKRVVSTALAGTTSVAKEAAEIIRRGSHGAVLAVRHTPGAVVGLSRLYVATFIVLLSTAFIAAILSVMYVKYPRPWVPVRRVPTRGRVQWFASHIASICDDLETTNFEPAVHVLGDPMCAMIRSRSSFVLQMLELMFRFDAFLPKDASATDTILQRTDGSVRPNLKWCYPDSTSEKVNAYFNAHRAHGSIKALCAFAIEYERFRKTVETTARSAMEQLEAPAGAPAGAPSSCSESTEKTDDKKKSAPFGPALLQRLNVIVNVEHERAVTIFARRRGVLADSHVPATELMNVVLAMSEAAFYDSIGDSAARLWHNGFVKLMFPEEAEKNCCRFAFDRAFSPDYANKYWIQLLREPISRYMNKNKQKAVVVEKYASKEEAHQRRIKGRRDPFFALSDGFNKVFKFILSFFWWIGFLLSNMRLVTELMLNFLLASAMWIAIRFVSIPGINWVAWNLYFFCIRVVPACRRLLVFAYRLALASLAWVCELVLRLFTGCHVGVMSLFPSDVECQAGVWDSWHSPDSFSRRFGCMYPCRVGFGEQGGMCVKSEHWKPDMCPINQAYRLYSGAGPIGRLSSLVDPAVSVSRYAHLPRKQAVVMGLKDVAKTAKFMKDCAEDPRTQPYRDLVKAICRDEAALKGSEALTKACQATHCVDASTQDAGAKKICSMTKEIGRVHHGMNSDEWERTEHADASCSPKPPPRKRKFRIILVIVSSLVALTVVSVMILMHLRLVAKGTSGLLPT